MGEYFFGLGRGRVKASVERRVDRIAKKHGARFVAVKLPGEGPRFWFSGPNRGEPFDRALALEVLAAVAAEGIELPGR